MMLLASLKNFKFKFLNIKELIKMFVIINALIYKSVSPNMWFTIKVDVAANNISCNKYLVVPTNHFYQCTLNSNEIEISLDLYIFHVAIIIKMFALHLALNLKLRHSEMIYFIKEGTVGI